MFYITHGSVAVCVQVEMSATPIYFFTGLTNLSLGIKNGRFRVIGFRRVILMYKLTAVRFKPLSVNNCIYPKMSICYSYNGNQMESW